MAPRELRPGDGEYPRLLEEIHDPPAPMFASGRRLEPSPTIAVVGTRTPSRYGLEVSAWLGRELAAAGAAVISGLARGIDAAAHRGALEAGGATVAVLGCGLDICYPVRNAALYRAIAEAGTLVSEYPAGTRPLAHHFPARNRIIAGMSLGVVIVEGRQTGGAMITARLAAEFGREVFAVAGPVHSLASEGPHALIRDGARLVTSAEDVLEDLGFTPPLRRGDEIELPPDERAVLSVLGAEPLLLDRVARSLRMPASAAASVLARLELKGAVARHPGGRFARAVGTSGAGAPHRARAGPAVRQRGFCN